jgi:hypothetical protein
VVGTFGPHQATWQHPPAPPLVAPFEGFDQPAHRVHLATLPGGRNAGDPGQLPVRDLQRRELPVPGGDLRPGVTPGLADRDGDLPARPVSTGGGLLQGAPRGRDRRDLPECLGPVAHDAEVADHAGAVGGRAGQVGEDPSPVQAAVRRRQRRRQARGQAGAVAELAEEDQARVRYDARSAAGDFEPAGPCGSVHVESAP